MSRAITEDGHLYRHTGHGFDEGNAMPRQRLIVATLLFLGAFAVIAQLAWNTAIATSGPWFSTAISRDVYSTTMIAATVLVAVLAALASGQSASAAREARALDLRLNILRGSGVSASGSGGIDIDADIEDTLNEILGGVDGSAAPLVTMDREAAHDTLVAVTTEGKALRQDVVLREVARARSALNKASSRIWGAVAGESDAITAGRRTRGLVKRTCLSPLCGLGRGLSQ